MIHCQGKLSIKPIRLILIYQYIICLTRLNCQKFFFLYCGRNEFLWKNLTEKSILKHAKNTISRELSIPHNGRDLSRIARGRACPTFYHHDNAVWENIPSSISDESLIYILFFFSVSQSNFSHFPLVPTHKNKKDRSIYCEIIPKCSIIATIIN